MQRLFLFAILVVCLSMSAAMPEAAKADPRHALGYVVVTHYPGVRADGTGDSTAGIQAAIQDAYENSLAVLFPAGTYVVTDTLKCYEWNYWDTRRNRAKNPDRRSHVLIGSTLGPNRPLIRLKAQAPQFGDPDQPRPILVYRVFTADNAQGTAPAEPEEPLLGEPPNFHDQPNILFSSELRGIDFDCGGNPGAIGVAFRAAQDSSIENVRIQATGATAGFRGLPGRNAGAANIEVEGGRYGIDLIDGGLAGTIAVGAHLFRQTELAIRSRDFCPFTMVGFQIVKAHGPAVRVDDSTWSTAMGTLCLVDGSMEVGDGVAVDNAQAGKTIYLRNVYVGGAAELIQSGAQPVVAGSGRWKHIAEYAYNDQRNPAGKPPYGAREQHFRVFSLIDGHESQVPEPVRVVETNVVPPPADLVSRHLWNAFPAYEGQDDGTQVVRAVPDEGQDDRAAIQAAIDAAETAGHGRVFLPAGTFEIGGTLTLRAHTQLFGVARRVTTITCHESWQPTSGEPTMVATVNDPEATTTLACLTISARTKGGGINALGANEYDRFNLIHWRAGRHSQVIAIAFAKEWVAQLNSNPHDYLKITDAGGGRFYFLAPSWRWFGRHPDSRAIRVVGTTEPLSIYGLNLEFVAPKPDATPASNVEMMDVANVRIYSVKREMATPTVILRNCRNIGIFGTGRQVTAPFAGSGGLIQVLGTSTGITVAPVVFDSMQGSPSGEATLREQLAGGENRQIIYPDCLSICRRGQLDDAAMR